MDNEKPRPVAAGAGLDSNASARIGDTSNTLSPRPKQARRRDTIIEAAALLLAEHHPMTVRQVYYQLVARQIIPNNRASYQAVSRALVAARCDGAISWEWIEDRLRRPRQVSQWDDLADFAEVAALSYRRDVWATQPHYVECWLEKDALSGIFEDELEPYGVTLNVGRGYDGWDSIRNAAGRFGNQPATIIYFGDFDPSGEDMVRSLGERLAHFDCRPNIVKAALTMEDIERYGLPPDPTKTTDSRRAKFIAKHGDKCVELDALPVDVLRDRIRTEIETRLNLEALDDVRCREALERQHLRAALGLPP